MKRQGFTLIELIVVIAILLILAAILYPVIQRPRGGNDRLSRCYSHLKQIGLAMAQYTQDYDDKYPAAIISRHGLEKPASWVGLIYPYIKTPLIFQCPSDEAAKDEKQSSYAYNAWLNDRATKYVTTPVSTIVNFEVAADPNNWTQTGTGPQAVSGRTRHIQNEGANYSFADGHVKYLKPELVTAGKPDGKNYTFAIK